MKWLILLLFLLASLGCSEDENSTSTNTNPTLTGNWFGSDTSHNLTMSALLSESNNIVTGSGQMIGISNGASTFTGVNIYPDVSLTIFRTNENDANFTGVFVNENMVRGVLNGGPGGGWHDLPMTLVRQ